MVMPVIREDFEGTGSAVLHFEAEIPGVFHVINDQIHPDLPIEVVIYEHIQHASAVIHDGAHFFYGLFGSMLDSEDCGTAVSLFLGMEQHITLVSGEDIAVLCPKQGDILYDDLSAHAEMLCQFGTADRGRTIHQIFSNCLSSYISVQIHGVPPRDHFGQWSVSCMIREKICLCIHHNITNMNWQKNSVEIYTKILYHIGTEEKSGKVGVRMKIERVDDKTVKCFLSNEELEEYEIDYKDFILRSDKAKEVVREIIEQAEVEVGYKPPKFAFDLQIMMLPDQGLLLTFSEKEPFEGKEGEQALEFIRQITDMIQKKGVQKTVVPPADNGPAQTGQTEKTDRDQPGNPEYAIFQFASLGDVLAFAKALPGNLRVRSELYRMEEQYYLYLHKGSASYVRYSRACIQALEFADLYGADEISFLYLKEHGECLIAEKALKKLCWK